MHDLELHLEIKEVQEDGTFSGIASMYGVEDLGGDVIDKGAFTKTLQENAVVPILWQHKTDEPVGRGTVKEWQSKILVSGKLELEEPTAQKAYRLLKKKIINGLSIGFQTMKATWEEIEEAGRTKFVRHIQELKLWEISIVTFPLLAQAQVTRVKSANLEDRLKEIEDQVSALSARSSTPVSVQEPEPREAKEPPSESREPVQDHSKLESMIAEMRSYVN